MLVSLKDLRKFVSKLNEELDRQPQEKDEVDLSAKEFKPMFKDFFKYFLDEPALSLFLVQLNTAGKVNKVSNFYSATLAAVNSQAIKTEVVKPDIKKEKEIVFEPHLLPVLGPDVDLETSIRNFDKGRLFLNKETLDQALVQLTKYTNRKYTTGKSYYATERNKITKYVFKCKRHKERRPDVTNLIDENPLGRFPLGVGCQSEIFLRNFYGREYAFCVEEVNLNHNEDCEPFPSFEYVDTDKVIEILYRRKLGYI